MLMTGIVGVELFFVLSGFLIGRIIIKEVIETGRWNSLKNFFIRRWLRTLPIYFVIVIGLFLMHRTFYWDYFLFLQNFNEVHLDFYSLTWSLSIEEWFYLIVPVIFLIGIKFFKGNARTVVFTICGLFIVGELIVRFIYTLAFEPTYDFGVRKQIFLRLDSLMFGVTLAGIKHYHPHIYQRISRSKTLFSLAFSGFMACCLYVYYLGFSDNLDNSYFFKTAYFSLNSLFITFIIASLEASQRLKSSPNIRGTKLILTLSLTSYSVYLLHGFVFAVTVKATEALNLDDIALISVGAWLIAVVITITFGFYIHRYFELPIMKYRDRITSLNASPPLEQTTTAKVNTL